MIDAEDLAEFHKSCAIASPEQLEAITLAARLVREVNVGSREAREAPDTIKRVRSLENAKAALILLLALRDRNSFIGLRRLDEVLEDLIEVQGQLKAKGHYALAGIAPIGPGDHASIAQILSPLLKLQPGTSGAIH